MYLLSAFGETLPDGFADGFVGGFVDGFADGFPDGLADGLLTICWFRRLATHDDFGQGPLPCFLFMSKTLLDYG